MNKLLELEADYDIFEKPITRSFQRGVSWVSATHTEAMIESQMFLLVSITNLPSPLIPITLYNLFAISISIQSVLGALN